MTHIPDDTDDMKNIQDELAGTVGYDIAFEWANQAAVPEVIDIEDLAERINLALLKAELTASIEQINRGLPEEMR